jgi:tetratricopeptide (TPR) repeat protein
MASKRRNRKKAKLVRPSAPATGTASASEPVQPMTLHLRKWIFRLAAVILAPVLFFTMLEAGLRLAGYGYPAGFYVGPDSKGTYQTNLQFGRRFFPPELVRTPIPGFISERPAGAIRIFILGGSAAQGIPNPEFGFGRILEAMLRHRYPDMKFEVINAAMTAINSYVTLEIARDCASHAPDLFVVYMGNNEVVGPYGPGTVFQKWIPNLQLIRANLLVKSSRTGQLLDNAMRSFRSDEGAGTWRGMEMFLDNPVMADDPRLSAVYRNYKRNLEDICAAGRGAGAEVILSTVAVGLSNCPPFQSLHRSDIAAEELKEWKSLYQAGVELESKKRWTDALQKYQSAARLDEQFAELQYRMGRCLAAVSRHRKAREHFLAACDRDVYRFRADTTINRIIREAADSQKAKGVRLADTERLLAAETAGGDSDAGMIFEHVHLTFDGNYLLARSVLEKAEEALQKLAAFGSPGSMPTREQCAEALALTPLDDYEMAEQMAEAMSRPPFLNQLDHEARMAADRKRVDSLRKIASSPEALHNARRICERALEKAPGDWILQRKMGKLALEDGEFETALDHLRIALNKHPWEPMLYVDLGYAERMTGRIDKAVAHYRKAIEMDPECGAAYTNLGAALAGQGRIEEAVGSFRKAVEIDPDDGAACMNLGGMLAGSGRIEEAIPYLQKAVEIDPRNALAYYSLGKAFAVRGYSSEAVAYFQQALEIDPDFAEARRQLRFVLQSAGSRTNQPVPLP